MEKETIDLTFALTFGFFLPNGQHPEGEFGNTLYLLINGLQVIFHYFIVNNKNNFFFLRLLIFVLFLNGFGNVLLGKFVHSLS